MKENRYSKYLKSDNWRLIREKLFAKRGEKCELCGKCWKIQVHHKTYKNVYKEKLEDLQVLCATCHQKTHDKINKEKKKKGNKPKNKPKNKPILEREYSFIDICEKTGKQIIHTRRKYYGVWTSGFSSITKLNRTVNIINKPYSLKEYEYVLDYEINDNDNRLDYLLYRDS